MVFHNFFRKCCVFKTATQYSPSLHPVMPCLVIHPMSPHQAVSQRSSSLRCMSHHVGSSKYTQYTYSSDNVALCRIRECVSGFNMVLTYGVLSFVYTSVPLTRCAVRVRHVVNNFSANLRRAKNTRCMERTPGASSSLCVRAKNRQILVLGKWYANCS